jgi:hypothetical protein
LGIPLAAINDGRLYRCLELERVSTPRSEEASVLHSLNVALPRPHLRLDRLDLTLPEERTLFEPVDDCSDKK